MFNQNQQSSQLSQQQQQKRSRRKGNEKEDGEWKCLDCCKSYLSYPAFYTHCKTKHDSKWPAYYNTPRPLDEIKRDRGRPRTNQDEQKQHEKEDQIFEFLGKLGQNNEEEESQNNCIRHYLKQPIHPTNSISHEIFQGKEQESLYKEIIAYLEKLNQRVVEQEQIWDFRDPLSLTNELEEFTFSNLKGVFFQLENEKQINLVSVVSVFLGWLSRHLKKKCYQDIVIVVALTAYYIKNHKEISKTLSPKEKVQLMLLKNNDGSEQQSQQQKSSSKKEKQEKEEADQLQDQEKDLKGTITNQAATYLKEKSYHQFESHISYLKGVDIAQAFVALFVDWLDAFADLELFYEE